MHDKNTEFCDMVHSWSVLDHVDNDKLLVMDPIHNMHDLLDLAGDCSL